jgi:hypothetical protein
MTRMFLNAVLWAHHTTLVEGKSSGWYLRSCILYARVLAWIICPSQYNHKCGPPPSKRMETFEYCIELPQCSGDVVGPISIVLQFPLENCCGATERKDPWCTEYFQARKIKRPRWIFEAELAEQVEQCDCGWRRRPGGARIALCLWKQDKEQRTRHEEDREDYS